MPRPRLIFPTEKIDRNTVKLQRALRRFFRYYRMGLLSRIETYNHGAAEILRNSANIRLSLQAFLEAKGLKWEGDFRPLNDADNEAFIRWSLVTADMAGQTNKAHSPGGACTCSEHLALKKASSEYWKSRDGIIRRLDGLAQDLNFRVVNNAMKIVAPTNEVSWLHWVTAGDDRVCEQCIKASMGGQNGYFKINWFTPNMPLHIGDRCQWEYVFGDPFGLS